MTPRPVDDVAPGTAAEPAGGQYFAPAPAAPSRRSTIQLVLPDLSFDLVTDRGMFSPDRVDAGTKALLLDGPPVPQGPVDLLDLGAGYAPIAITLARRSPQATVWAVEVNERARGVAAENAAAAGVGDRVRVVAPDDVPATVRFAGVWSNPPIRVGKPALHDLLLRWLARLRADGLGALVVQRHLGADTLARWLQEQGYAVDRRASMGGYRLFEVRPGPAGDPPQRPESRT